jgi:hypothetical protein
MQACKLYDDTATESFPGLRKVAETHSGTTRTRRPPHKAAIPKNTYQQPSPRIEVFQGQGWLVSVLCQLQYCGGGGGSSGGGDRRDGKQWAS